MNPMMMEEIRAANRNHYYQSSRVRAYCCGFISRSANTTYVCFLWAVISFYFAITAFLQKSPFYSYVGTVPLVAFGAINLLFGIVTLTSMVLLASSTQRLRVTAPAGIMTMADSKTVVFAITANAIAVLIVTLVNFILFIVNKKDFDMWCVGTSIAHIEQVYSFVNNRTLTPENRLSNSTHSYNCDRLFEDELKWSLLCLIVMFVVYTHWILIVAARKAYNFYYRGDPGPLISEFSNIAPKSKRATAMTTYSNVKPSKSILRDFLTHKQYGEFIPSTNQEETNRHSVMSNPFGDNNAIYNNSEVHPPCNAYYKRASDINSNYSISDTTSTAPHVGV